MKSATRMALPVYQIVGELCRRRSECWVKHFRPDRETTSLAGERDRHFALAPALLDEVTRAGEETTRRA